jgi:hypothetical protein
MLYSKYSSANTGLGKVFVEHLLDPFLELKSVMVAFWVDSSYYL